MAAIPIEDRSVFITADAKQLLFGNAPAIGKEISFGRGKTETLKVAGVLDCVKMSGERLPTPLCILPFLSGNADWSIFGLVSDIFIRTQDGMQEEKFIQQFRKEIGPKLQIGNYYFKQITSGRKLKENYSYSTGVTNRIRLQTGLAIFFLVNMMLGIIGTFWLRCNARKSEVGLRMAMGSTRNQVRWLFIAEGWILATVAVVLGDIIVFQYIYANGIPALGDTAAVGDYLINNTTLHYVCVCGIAYVLILITVAVGVWFPANSASKVEPVDALRDE